MIEFRVDNAAVDDIDEPKLECRGLSPPPQRYSLAASPMGDVTRLNPSSYQAEIYKLLINQPSMPWVRPLEESVHTLHSLTRSPAISSFTKPEATVMPGGDMGKMSQGSLACILLTPGSFFPHTLPLFASVLSRILFPRRRES